MVVVVLLGCESVPVEEGRKLREPPPGLMPASVAITSQPLIDTDANKYVDTIGIIVYLFPDQAQYPMPIWTYGGFEFTLVSSEDDTEIATWSFDPEETAASRFHTEIGPCYFFQLSLLDGGGSDEFDRLVCVLRAEFTPTDGGAPVDGVLRFQIGN